MTTTTQPQPPANAVAQDAHWAAKRERLRNRTRPTATLRICDDQAAKDALALAQYEQRTAVRNHEGDTSPAAKKALKAAEAAVAKAQQAVDDETIVLTFCALERIALDALKKEHPPTEEQAEDGYEFNVDTFGPVLVAAANTDGMTEDDAREYLETWGDAEAGALFQAAWGVQLESRLDLGKG